MVHAWFQEIYNNHENHTISLKKFDKILQCGKFEVDFKIGVFSN